MSFKLKLGCSFFSAATPAPSIVAVRCRGRGAVWQVGFVRLLNLRILEHLCSAQKKAHSISTLGCTRKGPRANGWGRPAADIRSYSTLTPLVTAHHKHLHVYVRSYLLHESEVVYSDFLDWQLESIDNALAAYGQHLYAAGGSLIGFSENLNAVTGDARILRGKLSNSWDAAWVWRSRPLSGNHITIPEQVSWRCWLS